MWQVIATKIEDKDKSMKLCWIAKTYKTHNAAQKFMLAQNKINKTYTFELNDITTSK